jgi:conjugative relaxase-like TrwC/TraI family protein
MLLLLFCEQMLSIGKIALGQHRYYEQQVAQGHDDYYAGRGEAPGEWVGAGARALGLEGRVSSGQFGALIAGSNPRDPGLRLRSSTTDPKVAALDLTFSAPKSVSILSAVAPDELRDELVAAHERALRSALSYLEETAVKVRRGHNGERVHAGEGLIAAAYRHRMSRALDPQLHTHVVAANLARGPDDRFTALHAAPLYRGAKTAGYLYQAELRALISERLGLEWGPVHKGAAELAALPKEVLHEFSKRRHEMERAALEGGIGLGTKASGQAAALATRDRKQYGVETHSWRAEVRARAGELGLGAREVRELLADGHARVMDGSAGGATADERALADKLTSPSGLTEKANTFDQRAVLQEFACAAGQGAHVSQVRAQAERFDGREDVLAAGPSEMTTAELVQCERRLIAAAVDRADERSGLIEPHLTEGAIAAAEPPLTAEQAGAVRATLSSGHGVSVIEALAGTGKTHTAGVLRAAYEGAGVQVLGVAPTGRAARELQEQAGIVARTLDRFLLDLQRLGEELPRASVVIFDEAGMAPTRASSRLLEAAERCGAKVIAIGDPAQLSSVGAGGWLRAVGREVGALRLSEVMRQRDPVERRALAALHERMPRAYLEWADRAGLIHTFDEQAGAREVAIGRWNEAVTQLGPCQVVMIARDNNTRAALNREARDLQKSVGALGEERSYGALAFAIGDRVICRRNDALMDVDNGMRGTVRHLDAEHVVIDTDGGLVRELPAGYVEENVEHAYALTGHGMQGGTVEAAIVLGSPLDLSAGWSYTALSRARGETQLLIYHERDRHARSELAPRDAAPARTRSELLARVERQMAQRDDEELAIEQLPAAGRPDDLALRGARALQTEQSQERAAARAEPLVPGSPRAARLRELREQIERLQAQLQALPRRELQRIEDFDARAVALASQREQLTQRLAELPAPRRRFARTRDEHEVERANLNSAIASADRELDYTLTHREHLARELGDAGEALAERDGVQGALSRLTHEQRELRDELAEREVREPSAWARKAFGERPAHTELRRSWEQGVREAARYRVQYEVTDSADALGPKPERGEQQREWEHAAQSVEHSRRELGREQHIERDLGIDIGF